VKLVLNKSIFLVLILFSMSVSAARKTHMYSYDYISPMKKQKSAAVIDPAPIAGRCAFSIGPAGGDSFILLQVSFNGEYVIAKSGVWTLHLPVAEVWPERWNADGSEYRNMGKEWVVIGRNKLLVNKIGAFGRGGIKDSAELWVSSKYGVVAYRPLDNPGRFLLSDLPDKSFLDCR
jgi:hypothetical protein